MYVNAMPVGMIGTNCYVLGDEATKSLAIIDPGDEADAIETMVEKSGMEVKMVLLTHGHFDHVTGLPGVLKLHPGVPVYINRLDYQEAISPNQFSNGVGEIPNVHFYQEGDTVSLGNLTIEVLSTPGHTPGSVTLKVEDALFTGDTLFAGSCGRTDFVGGSHREMMKSLKRLAELPGDYAVYPGHERTSRLSLERRYNSFMEAAVRRG
ncbi:MAG: MBL fold metallo-hydrolase [Oscillospiraceae bacterium]|nr:MBL fold metallo-hydrolase [Oscillospiraceae bacterium]